MTKLQRRILAERLFDLAGSAERREAVDKIERELEAQEGKKA